MALPPEFPTHFTTPQEVQAGFRIIRKHFLQANSHLGVFSVAYLEITNEITARINGKRFHDNQWTADYLVAFANLYLDALRNYLSGKLASVPAPWVNTFQVAEAGSTLIIQDLLLGINAHVNHDLPLALEKVGIRQNRDIKFQDHNAVNDALAAATDALQDKVVKYYAHGLGLLDKVLGNLDEIAAGFSVQAARENAWLHAVALTDAASTAERDRVYKSVVRTSSFLTKAILAPNMDVPWLIPLLRHLESLGHWTDVL